MKSRRWRLNRMRNSKLTQEKIIKDHLLAGNSITTSQAIQLYQINYFTTRLSRLRRKGLKINQESVMNDNGERYNVYWLDSDYIEAYKANGGNDA